MCSDGVHVVSILSSRRILFGDGDASYWQYLTSQMNQVKHPWWCYVSPFLLKMMCVSGLNSWFHARHLCDVVLISNDGREKHVHRIVLSAASSALKLLLGETFSEGEHIRRGQPIKIAASGDVVGALIDHIYGGEPTVSPADAVELLRLAGAYELPKLVAEIESDSCCCFKTCL